MVSDVIHISNHGDGIAEALRQAEKTAVFCELDERASVHLRLFAEEMLGMARALTGEHEGEFRIEAQNGKFRVILRILTQMTAEKRKNLLSASTTGKNAAAKGFMGKMKDLFERAFENAEDVYRGSLDATAPFLIAVPYGAENAPTAWTLSEYRKNLQTASAPQEEWDELERSVISKLADEVTVSIYGGAAEMTVEKTF